MTHLLNEQTAQQKRNIVLSELKKEISRIDALSQIEEREDSPDYRSPLSIELVKEVKILLSWGGGEDGFKLRFKDNDLLSGVYYMADWGQYEEVELNPDEADKVYQFYLYGEIPNTEN